jgi:N-acetylneuraminic acid mutarotase
VSFTATEISNWIDQDGDGLVGELKFRVAQVTSASSLSFPLFVTDPHAGTQLSITAGQMSVNGAPANGAVTTKVGDVVSVSPPANFTRGLLKIYLLNGATKVGAVSFFGHGTWVPAASMSVAREAHTATLLQNGKVLVAGRLAIPTTPTGSQPVLSSVEIYDPAADKWSPAASLTTPRSGHSATLLANGMVLVVGGEANVGGTFLSSAEIYGPSANTWTPVANMNSARYYPIATLLKNGTVLVVGGSTGSSSAPTEIYDPVANTWSLTGSMIVGRFGAMTATLFNDGRVLVAGGAISGTQTAAAEVYDPLSNSWTAVASMSYVRIYHTATLLQNGKVLVAGGTSGAAAVAQAELYDPVANAWTAAGTMITPRVAQTASTLSSGAVLTAGGGVFQGTQELASAELYDPTTNTWTATGSMSIGRTSHTATTLPNGYVLVGAGQTGPTALDETASCERYW